MTFFSEDFVAATPLSGHPLALISILIILWMFTHHMMEKAGRAEAIERPEPPRARTKVPILGHVYGLLRGRLSYITSLKAKSPTGICTLAFPGLPRVYVATNLSHVLELQRKARKLSFSEVASRVCSRLGGVSPESHQLLTSNPAANDPRTVSFFTECKTAIHNTVQSGPAYNAILRTVEDELQDLYQSSLSYAGGTMPLYSWLKHHVCLVTTNSIYGPHNPFQDSKLAEAFWAFNESAIPMLAVPKALLPILARKGYQGREKMVKAFMTYFESGHQRSASDVVMARHKVMVKYEVSLEDQARIEIMNCIALLENTVPSTFWTLYNTITRPELLSKIRTAAEAYVENSPSGPKVDLSIIRHDPLLFAVMNETIRCISNVQEARYIHEDDVDLNSGYRLRKNSLLLMPSRCNHMDTSVFPTLDFDYTRFLKSSPTSKDKTSFTPSGYRGFGAGESLCPGRHIATAEVLGILALFTIHYDIQEVSKDGSPLSEPGLTFTQLSLGFPRPNREVWVTIRKREN